MTAWQRRDGQALRLCDCSAVRSPGSMPGQTGFCRASAASKPSRDQRGRFRPAPPTRGGGRAWPSFARNARGHFLGPCIFAATSSASGCSRWPLSRDCRSLPIRETSPIQSMRPAASARRLLFEAAVQSSSMPCTRRLSSETRIEAVAAEAGVPFIGARGAGQCLEGAGEDPHAGCIGRDPRGGGATARQRDRAAERCYCGRERTLGARWSGTAYAPSKNCQQPQWLASDSPFSNAKPRESGGARRRIARRVSRAGCSGSRRCVAWVGTCPPRRRGGKG
jgi:hypothetical protein